MIGIKMEIVSKEIPDHSILGHNLLFYNEYFNSCIRTDKKGFNMYEFMQYMNDIRQTWDTLKRILNKV